MLESRHTKFNYIDNLLCYAFFSSTKPSVAVDLKSVIGFGDFIDHSVFIYEEMITSLAKLLQTEIIIRKDESYCTTHRFNELWLPKLNTQKKKGISKVLAELQEFLNTHFTTVVINDINSDMILSKEEFRFAVDAYLSK